MKSWKEMAEKTGLSEDQLQKIEAIILKDNYFPSRVGQTGNRDLLHRSWPTSAVFSDRAPGNDCQAYRSLKSRPDSGYGQRGENTQD